MMRIRPVVQRLISALLLTGSVVALFLPYFETFQETDPLFDFAVISQRPNPQQSGFFGGGTYTTCNGFASSHAGFNVLICFYLFVLGFIRHGKTKKHRGTILIVALASHLLLVLGKCAAGFVLLPPDTLLSGYLLLLICEAGLFVTVFRAVKTA